MDEMVEWANTIRETLKKEIRDGGSIVDLPCPFCGLPRCEREAYIRCSKCGVNWTPDDDYEKDPRFSHVQPKEKVVKGN